MNSNLRSILIFVGLGLLVYFFFFRTPDRPTPPADVYHQPPSVAERGEEVILPVRSGGLRADLSTWSGALHNLRIDDSQFRDQRSGRAMNLSTTWRELATPLRSDVAFTRDGRNVLPRFLTFAVESQTSRRVELVARPEGADVEVRRTLRAHTDYSFIVNTRVINHGAAGRVEFGQHVYQYTTRNEESGGLFRQSYQMLEALCRRTDGQMFRRGRDDLRYWNDGVYSNAQFVGVGNLYFVNALVPLGGEQVACHLRAQDAERRGEAGTLLRGTLSWRPTQLDREQSRDFRVIAYFGPKLRGSLAAASHVLSESVNLGFFAFIARGLLRLLQVLFRLVHNWGVAIMLLTVIVRIVLFPVLARSTKTLALMQKLKPELDVVNEKYKDNQEQKGLATMELYRKHKVNPLSGCLPQLAQLPVWWALYTTLQTSVELFHAPFGLWWRDLSAPDPYYVLPLVLGAVMFLQQILMPPSMPDPVQQKIMLYFMPIFLTAISLFLPAGLALYMLTNSVLAIAQQRITKAQIDRIVKTAADDIVVKPAPAIAPRENLPSSSDRRPNDKNRKGNRRGGRK